MRQTIIAGNWKMNTTPKEARTLAEALMQGIKGQSGMPAIVLCPPFTSLAQVLEATKGTDVRVGAQNMDYRDSGAFTGEVAPPMLVEMGVTHVLIGHSERRQFFGETNESVNLKLKAALKHKLVPIVCVGESLEQREKNHTDKVVTEQTVAALQGLSAEDLKTLVIAYEPVWAIGTGKVCEPAEAERVIKVIRKAMDSVHDKLGERVPVLYGGSVNAKNIDDQLSKPDIDGGLVGGASLKADEFLSIIQAGQKRARLATANK